MATHPRAPWGSRSITCSTSAASLIWQVRRRPPTLTPPPPSYGRYGLLLATTTVATGGGADTVQYVSPFLADAVGSLSLSHLTVTLRCPLGLGFYAQVMRLLT
jgi:hypothetical protein